MATNNTTKGRAAARRLDTLARARQTAAVLRVKRVQESAGTTAAVNRELARLGYAERLRQGRGYCYFTEGETAGWFSSSVPVCFVRHLTVGRWVEELECLRAEARRDGRAV